MTELLQACWLDLERAIARVTMDEAGEILKVASSKQGCSENGSGFPGPARAKQPIEYPDASPVDLQ